MVARIEESDDASGDTIHTIASDHAACLHGRQGYELRSVYPEGGTKETLPFRVTGEASEQDALDEPGNEKGILVTLQRQNARLLDHIERMAKPQSEVLGTLGDIVKDLQAQQASVFRERLEIASLTFEREQEQNRAALSQKKFDSLERMLGPLTKAVAAKLGLPMGSKRDVLLEFAASLDKEQQAAIAAVLTPAQMKLLGEKRYAELIESAIDGGQMSQVLPVLRPEQIALLDAAAGVEGETKKLNGASHAEA